MRVSVSAAANYPADRVVWRAPEHAAVAECVVVIPTIACRSIYARSTAKGNRRAFSNL
jgi:hypothetical protein